MEAINKVLSLLEAEGSLQLPDQWQQASWEQRFIWYRDGTNPRPVKEFLPGYLEAEDQMLEEAKLKRGIVGLEDLDFNYWQGRLALYRGDISRLDIEVIVNAANKSLLGCRLPRHWCVDNAIHSYAGSRLRRACQALVKDPGKGEATGLVKRTSAYHLPARFIYHTVGPLVSGEPSLENRQELASSYISSLKELRKEKRKEIAFPSISTGTFGFPKDQAVAIAVETVKEWMTEDMKVVFVLYSQADEDLYKEYLKDSKG